MTMPGTVRAPLTARSCLFVPADSEKKLAKADGTGADLLLLDLEDAVAAGRKPLARQMARAYLDASALPHRPQIWVRINDLATPFALADIAAIVGGRPDGLLLPKVRSGAEVTRLSDYLDCLEVREDLPPGHIRIMVILTETAESLFQMASFKDCTPRLAGLSWGGDDLAADVGALSNRDAEGKLLPFYQWARSLCVAAAAAAGVPAYDTPCMEIRNPDALNKAVAAARRDGFRGSFAVHPDQVATINQAFSPSTEEIAWASRVAAAFAAEPAAGVVSLDGRMLDRPHQRQAEAILALARTLSPG